MCRLFEFTYKHCEMLRELGKGIFLFIASDDYQYIKEFNHLEDFEVQASL